MPIASQFIEGIRTQLIEKVCDKRTFSAQLAGVDGPVVILLHGFPDNNLTFRFQVPALVEAGYRVLLPVLPGYELSSVDPAGRYFAPDLVGWLLDWIDETGEEKVHLVGHDWGAVIAWMMAASHPDRLHSLTAIAIPSLRHLARGVARYPSQLLKSWYMAFFQLPAVAEQALAVGDGWLIRQLWRRWSPGWSAPEAHLQAVCTQLTQPRIRQAALGYYRCLFKVLDPDHTESRRWLQRSVAVPTLMISGARDGCGDTRLFDVALVEADFPAGIELYRLMGAGHFCHLEKADLVSRKIVDFIGNAERRPAGIAGELARQLG